jgi:hypothetical protein
VIVRAVFYAHLVIILMEYDTGFPVMDRLQEIHAVRDVKQCYFCYGVQVTYTRIMRREKKPKGKNLNMYNRTNGAPENDSIGDFVACGVILDGVVEAGEGDEERMGIASGRAVVGTLRF